MTDVHVATIRHELVKLRTGDEVIANGDADVPNVIKIDVEGHEFDVLGGLRKTLADERLKNILIEVHFSVLAEHGKANAPRMIERQLHDAGFHIHWTDSSHLHAFK